VIVALSLSLSSLQRKRRINMRQKKNNNSRRYWAMRVSDFAYEAILDFETLKEISSNTRFLMEIELLSSHIFNI